MANKHYKKWIWQMPLGFLLVSAGIGAIVYSIYHRPAEEWRMWAVGSVVVFDIGLAILGSAFIHKIKSDLIRRERSRYHHPEQEEA
jgi:hypothetical protein